MSQSVGIQQTMHLQQMRAGSPATKFPAREKAVKEFSFQLPVELLRVIFEEYLRLDLPVQVLLEVNRQWRAVALKTQSLWRRLLLSDHAIPGSLRAGSVHACGFEGQTTRILDRSGIITKLEVTFVLGPKEGDTPTPEMRASLFKTVGHTALHRISFLCIIVNPEMTLPLVNASLDDVFRGELPCLESLMIASTQAIGNLYEPISALMDIIEESSEKLKSLYLENVNKDFILRASTKKFWTRLIQVTIRNEFDSLDASIFSLPPLEFIGELVATPAPFIAHLNSALKTRIEFPELEWLRVSLISTGTLARLNLPKFHTITIDRVQGSYCNALTLHDTNGNIVNPVGFETDAGSPSRGDVAMAMLHEVEAPDLSGLVSKTHKRPVFTGPYSKVYVGRYGHHKVAIKVLCVVKSDSVTDRKFRRERFIWWHLRHPNVLPLYGYFEDDDGVEVSHALVSEWAEGGCAARYIHQDLSWDQRMNLLHDVTKGLQYLHGMDPCVVHGDLKPLNVLINKDGVGQLCDFGLARLIQAKSGSGMTTTTAHTGTVRYLARELVECTERAIPTEATDVYALGCLALEFVYKVSPHSGLSNPWEISRAIWERKPPAESPMHPGEDAALWDLMESCWHIDPSQRPVAEDVCHYLDQNVHVLSRALETSDRIRSEGSYGPTTPRPTFASVPVLPMSPTPSVRSRSPRIPVVSSASPQPPQYALAPLSVEASGITGSDSTKALAPKKKESFCRQAYHFFVDAYIQLMSKVSSLNLSNFLS